MRGLERQQRHRLLPVPSRDRLIHRTDHASPAATAAGAAAAASRDHQAGGPVHDQAEVIPAHHQERVGRAEAKQAVRDKRASEWWWGHRAGRGLPRVLQQPRSKMNIKPGVTDRPYTHSVERLLRLPPVFPITGGLSSGHDGALGC